MLHPIFFQNQKLYTINGFNFKLRNITIYSIKLVN